jgi:hypothetical protein
MKHNEPPLPVTGIALSFHMEMMFVPHMKHHDPPLPVTGIALSFHMQMMFVPHMKHIYRPPQPVTLALLFFFTFKQVIETLYVGNRQWFADNRLEAECYNDSLQLKVTK